MTWDVRAADDASSCRHHRRRRRGRLCQLPASPLYATSTASSPGTDQVGPVTLNVHFNYKFKLLYQKVIQILLLAIKENIQNTKHISKTSKTQYTNYMQCNAHFSCLYFNYFTTLGIESPS